LNWLALRRAGEILKPGFEYDLAATHRSLWFGSCPRPATGSFLALDLVQFLAIHDHRYDRTNQPRGCLRAQAAGRALIAEGKAAGPKQRTFIYVNNRLEGNAISTIAAMIQPTS
jgi:hypothetical protein